MFRQDYVITCEISNGHTVVQGTNRKAPEQSFHITATNTASKVEVSGRTFIFSAPINILTFIRDTNYDGEEILNALVTDPEEPITVFCKDSFVQLLTTELQKEEDCFNESLHHDASHTSTMLYGVVHRESRKLLIRAIEDSINVTTFESANVVLRSLGMSNIRSEDVCAKLNPCIKAAVDALRLTAYEINTRQENTQ